MSLPPNTQPSLTPQVVAIALRSPRRGPMREVREAQAQAGGGLEGDGHVTPERGVTLLSREQWAQTIAELGVDLPWHTRRANLLVEGFDLAASIGWELNLGEVLLHVEGETEPCGVMDRAHFGLKRALTPDCRAGVHARVVRGGRIRVGNTIVAAPSRKSQARVECTIPVLPVRDLPRSIAFYTGTLGFQLDWGGQAGARICSVSRNGRHIMLSQLDQSTPGAWVWIGVEDDTLFQHYQSLGVKVLQEPRNHPWAYEMKFEDIDGNVLWLGTESRRDLPLAADL